jgi:putative ABC transport system substrate-binding protein
MRRRDLLAVLGGAAAAWPLAARSQQPAAQVVGFLGSESPGLFADRIGAFLKGLGETGFVEGRNVAIDYRWGEGHYDRLPELAADLVRRKPAVIAAAAFPAAEAAKAATTTIPIVFQVGADPVGSGLVGSLSRPGGNLTGIASLAAELIPKRLELLHELIPTAAVVGLLFNPTNSGQTSESLQTIQSAGRTLGLQVYRLPASTEHDFDVAFETLANLHAGGLVIAADAFFTARRERLGALTLRHAIPAIYELREFTAAV